MTSSAAPKRQIVQPITDKALASDEIANLHDTLLKRAAANVRARVLLQILTDPKFDKDFKLHVFALPDTGYERAHMFMLHGWKDDKMIKHAKAHALPRGCPILVLDDEVFIDGFFGKFKNDDNTEVDFSGFDGKSVIVGKKLSGFLGLLFFIKAADGELRYVVTCKNSASMESKFVDEFARMAEAMVADAKAEFTPDIYFSFEVMSSRDQCHGAAVKKPLAICTGAFRSVVVCRKDSKDSKDSLKDPERAKLNLPLSIREAHELIMTFASIPRLGYALVGGQHTKEFLELVRKRRDLMTDACFDEILRGMLDDGKIEWLEGNATHADVLGDTLEGVVMFFEDSSSCKLKFPLYTWRTMFLRMYMQEVYAGKKKNKQQQQKQNSNGIEHVINTFCKRWVISPRNRIVFEQALRLAVVELEALGSYDAEGDGRPATHIVIADALAARACFDGLDVIEPSADGGGASLESSECIRIIACKGPYASGKTTAAKAIVQKLEELGVACELVDSDGGGAMRQGHERNNVFKTSVLSAILRGRVPVLAFSFQLSGCVGGLRGFLRSALGVPVHITLCIASMDVDAIFSPEKVEADMRGRNAVPDDDPSFMGNKLPEELIEKLMGRLTDYKSMIEEDVADADVVTTFSEVVRNPQTLLECAAAIPQHIHNKIQKIVVMHDRRVGHVTVHYGQGLVGADAVAKMLDVVRELPVTLGRLVTMTRRQEDDDKKTTINTKKKGKKTNDLAQFIVLQELIDRGIKATAHVTVSVPTAFQAEWMNAATSAFLEGRPSVRLPSDDEFGVEYTFRGAEPISVDLLGVSLF